MVYNQNNTADSSIDSTQSYETGVWNNLKIIFQQQIMRYMTAIEQKGGGRTINDLNGLLSFLENTINNSLSVFIKQKISISKLNPITGPRIKAGHRLVPQQQDNLTQQQSQTESHKRKNKVHLSESDLHRIIKEAVVGALNEIGDTKHGQFALNAVSGRAVARPAYHND